MSDPEFSLEEVARYWDDNAAAWAGEVRQGRDVAREFLNNPASLAFIGDLRGREVLDAGCGEGYNTRILARTGAHMTGVDLSTVVSFMALMDGPRFDLAMAECFRTLRPGGLLAFSITHPCFITKGARWIRDEQGNYFDPARWVERWRFTDAPPEAPEFVVPRFDRTLSEYINTLTGVGFVFKRIEEPRPPEEYCQAHPGQRGWRDHAALFLHVLAEKPS